MNFELWILDFIQTLRFPILDQIMKGITFLGDKGLIWISLALLLCFFKKTRKIGILMITGLILNALICNVILKPCIQRLRPFTYYDVSLIVSEPKDYSFPSGHTSASFVCCSIFYFLKRKEFPLLLILALLISFSRLYLYVHFPTDVLAGILLGTLNGWLSLILYRKYKGENQLT